MTTRDPALSDAPTDSPTSRARWAILVGVLGAMIGLHYSLNNAVPGLASAEASYSSEVVPGAPLLTKAALDADRKAGSDGLRRTSSLHFLAALAGLYAAYSLALRTLAAGSSRRLEWFVFAGGLVLMVAQMPSPVLLSTDVLSYAQHGRTIALYGCDPTAASHPLAQDDPFLALMEGRYPVWPYGALGTLVSAATAKVGGEHVGFTILLFRITATACILGGALALWWKLRDRLPSQVAAGLATFLWNPLVTIEASGGGHNDAMMVGLLMIALAWQGTGRSGRTMAALTLSVLVKYVTIVLIPLFLAAELLRAKTPEERRRRAARCVMGMILPAVLVVGLQRSLITKSAGASGFESLLSMTVGQEYVNSWHELVFPELRRALGEPPELADLPASFAGWWVAPQAGATFRAEPRESSAASSLVEGEPLLVVGVAGEDWLVVRRRDKKPGYIPTAQAHTIDRPGWVDADADFKLWEWSPGSTETAILASRILRFGTLGLFGLFWLKALVRVVRGGELIPAATVVLLAVCYLLGGWFWPWYTLWPLATAAMIPRSRLAFFSCLLSAGVLTLYVTIGGPAEIDKFRSVFAFGLPILLFAVMLPFDRNWKP